MVCIKHSMQRILVVFCETQLAVVLFNCVSASTLIWANGTPPRYTIRGLNLLGSNSVSSQRDMRILREKWTYHHISSWSQTQNIFRIYGLFMAHWLSWQTIYKQNLIRKLIPLFDRERENRTAFCTSFVLQFVNSLDWVERKATKTATINKRFMLARKEFIMHITESGQLSFNSSMNWYIQLLSFFFFWRSAA